MDCRRLGIYKAFYSDCKSACSVPICEKPELVKTQLRNMIIVPDMIGIVVGVDNGKTCNQIEIKPEMIGHYLALFLISYKHVKHGRPGKFVRSDCTTPLNVVPWETYGESVLREACPTRASFHNLLLLSLFIEIGRSSGIDDEVVQDHRQRDDNDLQDERQIQPSYKWIFKKKMKSDGTIDKYKVRLVIKGFRQREGLDFLDTYLPITRITSIRMVLAIAALRKLEVHQMSMKMTFLNVDLENVLYMNQPEGFMALGLESKVCRLVKSLYDSMKALKQGQQFLPYHVRMWI
ncbi:calcineurin B-like protein 4 [Tanacetum coccineum]|uniref:Calcineurin B-like protein 4 n=1 Tax=Tanacetum coccineum TaxID=301880 RepID=A0ABQ5GU61_9ASTR